MLTIGTLRQWIARNKKHRLRRSVDRPHPVLADCAAECLEVRRLLSNVTVSLNAGILALTGDSGDHTIAATVSGGNLQLAGANGTTFTFQGATNASVSIPVSPLTGLMITMQGGNDNITFDAANLGTISGNVDVMLGDGTNSLIFKDATVTGTTLIMGGSGADSVQLSNDVLHDVSILTGEGDDSVQLSNITLSASQVYANLIASVPSLSQTLGGITSGGSLLIDMGSGHDTLNLDTVTSANAMLNGVWSVLLGSGNDNATFTSVQTHGPTIVAGGIGAHIGTTSSNFGGATIVATSGNSSQINVNSSTFVGPAILSTGVGDSPSISVEDSSFQSATAFVEVGQNATLNLESSITTGAGTNFAGPVVAVLAGPSAIANLGSPASADKLAFASFAVFVGGSPDATVNIATAVTTLDNNKLVLISAKRHNV